MLQTSAFLSKFPNEDDSCQLTAVAEKLCYVPGDELRVSVDLLVKRTLVNVRAIYWHFFGAEFLEREAGYLSRHIVIDKKEFLVGEPSALELGDKQGPDVADRTLVFEPELFLWDVRVELPQSMPPTFRSQSARIDYFFSVTLIRKGESTLEEKIFVPITTNFGSDIDLSEKINHVEAGEIPVTGISKYFYTASSKLFVVLDASLYQFCPYGMENPCISVHLSLSSHHSKVISEFRAKISSKTIHHHADRDVTESAIICESVLPLIPPLLPLTSQEYYVQIPITENGEKFVNPSRFSSRCVFNEYFVTIDVSGVTHKFCVCVSTFNPNPPPKSKELLHKWEPKPFVISTNSLSNPSIERVTEQVSNQEIQPQIQPQSQSQSNEINTPNQNTNHTKTIEARDWTVEQVGEWLQENNLGKFVENFASQEIDGNALLTLEEKYFGAVGVKLVGDVLKLTSALEQLKN